MCELAKQIVELDVREMLRSKQDPFERIMETVQTLAPDDVLELHATFRPEPLLKVMQRQGFHHAVLEQTPDHVVVQFYRKEAELPLFYLDNRGLEPPQPMVRTLELLDQEESFKNGSLGMEIWNERVPALLFPELTERTYQYQVMDEEEGIVSVKIWREK